IVKRFEIPLAHPPFRRRHRRFTSGCQLGSTPSVPDARCIITPLSTSKAAAMEGLDQYLTVTQAAQLRRVTRQTVLESIMRGTLKAARVGNQWLIHRRDLAAFKPHAGGKVKRKR